MRIYLILALILAIIVTIFAVQNSKAVDVSFLTFELNGSLALVLMITLAIGIIIGILVSAPAAIRRRMEISGLKKNVRKMEKDLTTAREATIVASAPKAESNVPEDGKSEGVSDSDPK